MDKAPTSKNIASPFATGGGGPHFESLVGAYYLASVLLQSVPRGMEAGIAREVQFQRLYEGQPLDDLIVISEVLAGQAKLALQIKHDLTFGAKDKIFDDVMRACWQTFKSPKFTPGTDRFGVAIGLYSKGVDEYYQNVLTWTRSSASAADFLKRVSQKGLSNKTQRSFVNLIRTKLDAYAGAAVSDDDLWNFLRSMVILHFDFQRAGSRDYAYAVEMLKNLLSPDRRAESPGLFSRLGDYSDEANESAGSLDADALRLKLQADDFALLSPPNCLADLDRLREHAGFILDDIRTDVGNLVLNRSNVINDAFEKISNVSFLELIGPAGSGKSAILKALAQGQQSEGLPIVLSRDRLVGVVGWNGLARDLQLERRLNQILLAISGSANPCLFINDADRIVELGAQRAVNDLIRAIAKMPLSQDGSKHWTVVICAREENLRDLHEWLDWRVLGVPTTHEIPQLTMEEVNVIADYSPRLRPLLSDRKLNKVITNPFMLRLLEDQRMLSNLDALPSVATEVEVSRTWWEKVIGADGARGIARQQALLELGKQSIRSLGSLLSIEGIDADVIHSLTLDGILTRDPIRDAYRFSHDLFEDWVLYRILDLHRNDLPTYLLELGQPIGLLRSIRLLGLFHLEYDSVEDWIQLIEGIEANPSLAPRWRQVLLTAPLHSSHAFNLLNKVETFLFDNGAGRLIDLLITVRTVEINPDYSVLAGARMVSDRPEEIMSNLLISPVPRWHVWTPILRWVVKRGEALPPVVRPEAVKLMDIWQQKTPDYSPVRKEIAKLALSWLKEVERNSRYGPQ